uniref:CDGSH iron sulfur domain 1 n=1 Tax=Junco hyemalis TaxID=40217 RepID=A0A8C5JKQ8_JUNHY
MGPGQNCTVRAEWVAAASIAAGAAALGYLAYKAILCKDKASKAMVNPNIQKDNPKVVHAFDMEDLGDKAVYCRCWRSKKVREEGMGPVLFMFIVHKLVNLSAKLF